MSCERHDAAAIDGTQQPADDERAPMTMNERGAWVSLVMFVATSVAYGAVVVPRALSEPIEQVSWVVPMLWAIGIAIVGTIAGSITAAIGSAIGLALRGRDPSVELDSDVRDQEIDWLGTRATQGVTGMGLLAVLVLAMLGADVFWIGNAAFATGAVGAIVETTVKIRAYRRGF